MAAKMSYAYLFKYIIIGDTGRQHPEVAGNGPQLDRVTDWGGNLHPFPLLEQGEGGDARECYGVRKQNNR